ncbi:nucleotidyl transferase AbiEii/AbiGii toxin family protein [Hymenobacter volaticus]|uniref:Nucleotidyl transferase AbiEii/AbiGii toxin family protein n=1 Tax=Hymenobacter volaticus TaxID=2932254 RepID=A0ABY4GE90_9BACT|nr:nucleotidyl transferase AbiEii/AbiGii toxin family protein [Hymenobacter volaticus]UOQ69168.1 nucleotidyl transferase AbiEii/AbiGii toxin family protein [Hymenobacter volaticus]
MLDISSIPPERRYPAGLDLVLPALTRGLQHLGLNFFLVGAVARDLWLDTTLAATPRRRTLDVDLAVLVAHETEYQHLRSWLATHEQFHAPASSAFCLIHEPTGVQVDLMPFGGIADAEGRVHIAGSGLTSISVVGLAEVLTRATPVRVTDQITWQAVTLPGLVGLKLLAWDDRPEQRGKDGTDLRLILQHYHALITDVIFTRHYELLETLAVNTGYDLMCLAGIQVLGQELGALVSPSPPLHERLLRILTTQIQLNTASQLAQAMAQSISPADRTTPSVSQARQWLSFLLTGLQSSLTGYPTTSKN